MVYRSIDEVWEKYCPEDFKKRKRDSRIAIVGRETVEAEELVAEVLKSVERDLEDLVL